MGRPLLTSPLEPRYASQAETAGSHLPDTLKLLGYNRERS